MTQNQIDRLRQCKRKAMELESELRILDTELSIAFHKNIDNDSIRKNAIKVNDAYVLSYNLHNKLNATIL
jgi:hypothetical protein